MHCKGSHFDCNHQIFFLLFLYKLQKSGYPVRMPEKWWYDCG